LALCDNTPRRRVMMEMPKVWQIGLHYWKK
jgi:hypothetical protein